MHNHYVCEFFRSHKYNQSRNWRQSTTGDTNGGGLCYRSSDWLTPAHKWTEVGRRCAEKFYFIICARWGDRDSESAKSDGIFSEFKLKLCNLGKGEGVWGGGIWMGVSAE